MERIRINSHEMPRLQDAMTKLAEHHNAVAASHAGIYPTAPIARSIKKLSAMIEAGAAVAEAIEEDGAIMGFIVVQFDGKKGLLDYLFVDESCRGKGYGRVLMDRAMELFEERGITLVDIKVVDGNAAAQFYEKYGFWKRETVYTRLA